MLKKAFFISLILGFNVLSAQLHVFTHYNEPYTPLTNATELLTPSNTILLDSTVITLPPDLNFNIWGVNTNGRIVLLGYQGIISNTDGTTWEVQETPYIPNVYVLQALNVEAYGHNVHMSYTIENTAPNRIMKIQFSNYGFFHSGNNGQTDSVDFQYWLYEGSNRIEFHYGSAYTESPSTLGAHSARFAYFEDESSIYKCLAIHGTPSSPSVFYEEGIENGQIPLFFTYNLLETPATGQVYAFEPSTIGIDELTTSDYLYPNPTNGSLVLRRDHSSSVHVTIKTALGQSVASFHGSTVLDISQLPKGIYFAVIEDGNKVYLQKIIKE